MCKHHHNLINYILLIYKTELVQKVYTLAQNQLLPCSNVQSPQFISSLLSPAPQSGTKSHTLIELIHLLFLHFTAHGLGVGVGVGA